MNEPCVIAFGDERASDVSAAGGKGASLARLTRAGFQVPAGVVVTAAAYRAFIASVPTLGGYAASLEPERADVLRAQCAAIRELLLATPLPPTVESEIREAGGALLAHGPVSVRSSATLEDLAGAAFAGQHDTFLDMASADAVVDGVRRCWASLWGDRAVRYRHERGFAGRTVEMAVVIQHMIAADVAGVAFSIHPITGALDHVLINAAWGLGETVVSGEGGVDQWVLNKDTGDTIDQHIGDKTQRVVGSGAGALRAAVPFALRSAPSLSDAQRRDLATLVRRVERFYGFPQDIEFAFFTERLFLLQSRPVTHFPERWTRDEAAERFPYPLTPLTWDFTSAGFHESLNHSLALMGLPSFEGRWFERFDGYVYGNQTAIELFTAGYETRFDTLAELEAMIPVLRQRYRWVQQLPVSWARDLDRYLIGIGRLGSRDLCALDAAELWQHLLAIDALGRDYFLPNIAISITQGLLHRTLYRLALMVAGPERAALLYDGLTAFCETKTGVVNADLYELYRSARSEPALSQLLLEQDRRALVQSGALDQHPAFARAFARFLDLHGHREVEFDAYQPTWIGQPWVVLETLRLMLMQRAVPEPAARDQELRIRQQQTEREFLGLLQEPLCTFAGELIRLTRAYTSLDDLEHYQTTRLTVPFRAALVELGRRFVQQGALDEAEDVFFLQRTDIEDYLSARIDCSTVLEHARTGKREHARQLDTTPPHVLGESEAEIVDGELRGLPGSPGIAEGPVRLVHSAADFADFMPGSVLVARTTNPAWTPLFYSACAVVTESGGPLSHGAVTAREVGIPAVMAVDRALHRLAPGTRVRVDGTRGTVVVLTP